MTYLPMGDVAPSEFNATKYPGIVKPSTDATRLVFVRMQQQLNRVAASKGIATIGTDGDIGPGTLSLFSKVQGTLIAHATSVQNLAGAAKVATANTVVSLAMVADVVGDVAAAYANSINAPAKAPAPTPTKPPTLVNAAGQEFAAPEPDAFSKVFGRSLSSTEKLLVLGVFGGIGYLLYKGMAKKGRRKK